MKRKRLTLVSVEEVHVKISLALVAYGQGNRQDQSGIVRACDTASIPGVNFIVFIIFTIAAL